MKYRKKPIVIEAYKFGVELTPQWMLEALKNGDAQVTDFSIPPYCEIKTLEGVMRALKGDYIIKGIKDELYPCKSEIFEASYEPVED